MPGFTILADLIVLFLWVPYYNTILPQSPTLVIQVLVLPLFKQTLPSTYRGRYIEYDVRYVTFIVRVLGSLQRALKL